MSVSVMDCEPDIDIRCDGCEAALSESSRIYCSKCAGRASEEHEITCATCRKPFPRTEMFGKITGIMCHHCAFLYEVELAGLCKRTKSRSSRKKVNSGEPPKEAA